MEIDLRAFKRMNTPEGARHLAWRLKKAEQLRSQGNFVGAMRVLLSTPDDDHDCHASEDDGCDHPSHGEDITD